MRGAAVAVLVLAVALTANALYIPGTRRVDYFRGESLRFQASALESVKTQISKDYYDVFDVPAKCRGTDKKNGNLGNVLLGDARHNTTYAVKALVEQHCALACRAWVVKADKAAELNAMIVDDYEINFSLDNLPLGEASKKGSTISLGLPLGWVSENGVAHFNNHYQITVMYSDAKGSKDAFNIVRVLGEALSVDNYGNTEDCSTSQLPPLRLKDKKGSTTHVSLTYSVHWKKITTPWRKRWNAYLSTPEDTSSHWWSLFTSLTITLFMTGGVAVILMRILRSQDSFSRMDSPDEAIEETGWKFISADVFRPPRYPMLLSACVGYGWQLIATSVFTLCFAATGFLSPANRGSLLTALITFYVLCGFFAGYRSARLYKSLSARSWFKNALLTASFVPGIFAFLFVLCDIVLWAAGSSSAASFGVVVGVFAMWLVIQVPLTVAGAYLGDWRAKIDPPTRTNQLPAPIRDQRWYHKKITTMPLGGVLIFGVVFIEWFFVLQTVWFHQYYYYFGFLSATFGLLLITTAEVSIFLVFAQLCAEDYRWWWRAFLTPAMSGVFMFLYAIMFLMSYLELSHGSSKLIFLGYTFMMCLGVSTIAGGAGFIGVYWFVYKIYGSAKVD